MGPSAKPWVRRAQRLVRMVSELHRMGHQRLRIMPHEAPLGWRCVIAPAGRFSRHNGALIPDDAYTAPGDEKPWYTSAQEDRYFDWSDGPGSNARALAEKFLARLPLTAAAGAGRDWRYAGWLAELVGRLEAGDLLPMLYAEDYILPLHEIGFMPLRDYGRVGVTLTDFPKPPPVAAKDPKPPPSGVTHPEVTGLAATLTLAGTPNYLGDPGVVSELLHRVVTASIELFRSDISYADVISVNQAVSAAFDGSDVTYTLMPGWHADAGLGRTLMKVFALDPASHEGDYPYTVSEALIAFHGRVRGLLQAFMEDDAAMSWEDHAVPQLQALAGFVGSVFLGTNDLFYPGKSLRDFEWRSPAAAPPG